MEPSWIPPTRWRSWGWRVGNGPTYSSCHGSFGNLENRRVYSTRVATLQYRIGVAMRCDSPRVRHEICECRYICHVSLRHRPSLWMRVSLTPVRANWPRTRGASAGRSGSCRSLAARAWTGRRVLVDEGDGIGGVGSRIWSRGLHESRIIRRLRPGTCANAGATAAATSEFTDVFWIGPP
jgi:hypothetical protein